MTGRHRGPRRWQIWPASDWAIAAVFILGMACCTTAIIGLSIYGAGII